MADPEDGIDEARRHLRSLLAVAPVVIWELDKDGVVTLSEGRALAALGLAPQQLVGQSVFDVYKDRPDVMDSARRALAGDEFTVVSEFGETFLEARFTPKRDESGAIVGMVGVGIDVTEHVRMQRAVQGLSRRLWAVLEEERRRIARELHDEAGQTMTALKLLLDRAAHSEPDESRKLICEAKTLCSSVLEELRRISLDLRPGGLDELGLRPSLEALVDRFGRTAGVQARLDAPETMPCVEPDAQAAIYRFVQEALTNVTRHARAKNVDVRMLAAPKRMYVEAQDDGVGFVPAQAFGGPGLGLIGMKERSRMLGGRLVVDSAPGRGTRIRLELPLAA